MLSMGARSPTNSATDLEATCLAAIGNSLSVPSVTPFVIRHQLHDLLRLARIPWVADFLFSAEMTSLSALTAPLNVHHAVSCTVHMTQVQCDRAFDHRPFDLNLNSSLIFVPAFSVGPISMGFGVQECFANCFADWNLRVENNPSSVNPNHFRFVRDDENGILLVLNRNHRTGCVKMETISQSSESSRRRVFAVFKHDALQKAVHAEQGILPIDAVLDALTVINFLTESRDCSRCGAVAASPCKCKVMTILPAHPLDFSPMQNNMSTYLGSWEGLALSALVDKGKDYLKANVGSVTQILGGRDRDLLSRLSRWAISDQLNSRKQNPLPLIVPSGDTQVDNNETSRGNVDMDSTGFLLNDSEVEPFEAASALLDEDLNASSCSSGSGGIIMNGGKRGTGILTVDKLDDAESLQDIDVGDSDPERGIVDESKIGGSEWTETSDEALALVNKITEITGDEDMGGVDVAVSYSLASISNVLPTLDDAKSGPEDTEETPVLKTLSIAPAAVTSSSELMQEQDVKELRAQRRKQRNREAAQRSNARRKMKNDTLKKVLKETHERAAQLRARELSLREENLRLRKLTSG